jgi:methyl-accepting chemotaxis protein
MKRSLTIETKLTMAFAAMAMLVIALLIVYLMAGRTSNARLRQVVAIQTQKLAIGSQIELATTEMQGSQRGLVLSYAMNDPASSEQYKQLYAVSGKKIDSLVTEMQSLLNSAAENDDLSRIIRNRKAWAPRFDALVSLCESGQIAQAYKLRSQNKLISAEMHAAATDLVNQQNKALEQIKASSGKDTSRSDLIAVLIACFSLLCGGAVLLVIRGINSALRYAVSELCESAGRTARAASRISSSSHSLVQGSSEQLTSLEETSAASEEINTMAARNSENTRLAADLVTQSQQRFLETNDSLKQMVVAMDEIKDSSSKISRIIRTIDEIAFQTNLLALNASVEAARAGEAGLGFAVVADEVRNLAQRSAQASKDTAGLIEESISRSNAGKIKVDEVAVAICAITQESAKVKMLVDEVNVGSHEQAKGIEQIARAITNMERVTQKNVTDAGDSESAAEQLTAQSETLKQTVERLSALLGATNNP